jgi:proton-dependent oligopeptide transporter, POT family
MDDMAATAQQSGGWFGEHPRGLFYLSFTEMWERFSFYGMSALLALYMVKELLIPANAASVVGLPGLRDIFEFRGPMTNVAFAAILYGWYAGLVYFTPILGGWVADRILGAKRTVMIGVLLMSAGHLAMSFYATFLVALLLLIVGSGFLKGNISAQIGSLYPQQDEAKRSRAFTIFSAGICVGAATGPLVTGLVAANYGWHAGFAVAAALMLVALVTYALGQRHLPDDRPRVVERGKAARLTPDERSRVWALLIVIILVIPAEIAYPMVWSIGLLWVDQYVNLVTPLGAVPASWFASMDSIGAIIAAPALVLFWAWQMRRGHDASSVTKIGIGTAVVGIAALIIAYGSMQADNMPGVWIVWPLAAWLIMGLAWMCYWPTMLALVSRSAPPAVASRLMGIAFLAPFAGHTLAGWIGSYFDQMPPTTFWLMDAGIALAGAVIILLFRKPIARGLDPI